MGTPLTKLLHNSIKFKWSLKFQESFEKLKTMVTKALVLTQLVPKMDFIVYSDASHNGLGCVFMQEGRVVAYDSR